MSIYLPGLAISGYRSFGPKIQRMGPFSRLNIFVGANNVGKSNILKFIHSHLGLFSQGGLAANSSPIQWHLDGYNISPIPIKMAVGCPPSHPFFNEVKQAVGAENWERLDRLMAAPVLRQETDCVWFDGTMSRENSNPEHLVPIDPILEYPGVSHPEIVALSQRLFPNRQYGDFKVMVGELLRKLSTVQLVRTRAHLVPAVRSIDVANDKAFGLSDFVGDNVMNVLRDLQAPSKENDADRELWRQIQLFVQAVLGVKSATLEIPARVNEFNVRIDGQLLHVESLGHGIHELIVFAVASVAVKNAIVCLEEPELHIHPVLQRKLLRFLLENTTNQYFITTHSAHLIDAVEDATCFHVSLEDKQTVVKQVKAASDRWEICRDLGYKASDLMQANCVIWVEVTSVDFLYQGL